MFEKGRIDAVAGTSLSLFYHLSKFDHIENTIEVGNHFVLDTKEQWLQMSKKSTRLDTIPKLQQAVEQLTKNGDYDRIMRKYHGKMVQ